MAALGFLLFVVICAMNNFVTELFAIAKEIFTADHT